MKKIKFSSLLVLLSFSCLLFACSSDDEKIENKNDEEITREITGSWKLVLDEGREVSLTSGKIYEWSDVETATYIMHFYGDGTGMEYFKSEEDEDGKYSEDESTFNWTIKDKKLRMYWTSDPDYWTITELTSNTLVIEISGKDSSYEYYYKESYIRIK